ncbi:uncharacterized protein G2W53_013446 [Senna tora]|uniref:Uncharacterized protein n=1 Tax=Senna tora TaxID=362788 RepID=A0A834TYR8_9FABA|nr:uncharacterized protein G2W53_013446 [Senna tora]
MAYTCDESNGDENPKNSDITLNALRQQIERMNVGIMNLNTQDIQIRILTC